MQGDVALDRLVVGVELESSLWWLFIVAGVGVGPLLEKGGRTLTTETVVGMGDIVQGEELGKSLGPKAGVPTEVKLGRVHRCDIFTQIRALEGKDGLETLLFLLVKECGVCGFKLTLRLKLRSPLNVGPSLRVGAAETTMADTMMVARTAMRRISMVGSIVEAKER